MAKYTFRCEYVRCCKDSCKTCPHGPYWYGYWRENGRTRKRYFGKRDPRPDHEQGPWEAILCDRTANEDLACEIIGIDPATREASARKVFRERIMRCHPDRGGTDKEAAYVLAAWTWLKAARDWR